MTDMHLSRIAEWLVHTLAKAFAMSLAVAFVVSLFAAMANEPRVLWFAALAGPLTFAGALYWSSAPMPYTDEELGVEREESLSA